MKKTMMYIAAAFMAISLAACTPTPQKEAETAVTVENTQGGGQLVEGKVRRKTPFPYTVSMRTEADYYRIWIL